MIVRFAIAALVALAAVSAQAADKPKYTSYPKGAKPKAAAPAPLPDLVRVALVTELGTIELELDHKRAPITAANFVRYVETKRFDGMLFYRAMHLPWGEAPNGLIQGGLNTFPAKLMKPIAHEPTSQTGLTHKAGALSMARNGPGTATAEFSILLSELTSLDADPKAASADAQAGYAVFGQVVSGMDVVRKIFDAPRSPTKGEGVMKGQMLAPAIKVLSARRVTIPPL